MNINFSIKYINDIKGYGIFSLQEIKKGDIIYILSNDQNAINIKDSEIDNYITNTVKNSDKIKNFFYHAFSYNEESCIDLTKSQMQFMNHSFNPNSTIDSNGNSICIKDIHINDEITEDYTLYSNPPTYRKICEYWVGSTISDMAKNFI